MHPGLCGVAATMMLTVFLCTDSADCRMARKPAAKQQLAEGSQHPLVFGKGGENLLSYAVVRGMQDIQAPWLKRSPSVLPMWSSPV